MKRLLVMWLALFVVGLWFFAPIYMNVSGPMCSDTFDCPVTTTVIVWEPTVVAAAIAATAITVILAGLFRIPAWRGLFRRQ